MNTGTMSPKTGPAAKETMGWPIRVPTLSIIDSNVRIPKAGKVMNTPNVRKIVEKYFPLPNAKLAMQRATSQTLIIRRILI